MIPFQLIAVPFILFWSGRNLYRAIKSGLRRKSALLSSTIWLVVCACVLRPELTTAIAARLGIGRGVDLVFYFFCFSFLLIVFYGYNRFQQVDAALTQIVRHLALVNVSGGPTEGIVSPAGHQEPAFRETVGPDPAN
jgi:hypothetical protein